MSHVIFNAANAYGGNSNNTAIQCPQCHNTNVTPNGTLTVNGAPHDAYKCSSCRNDFSAVNDGVAALINTITNDPVFGGQKPQVGFMGHGSAGGSGGNLYGGSTIQYGTPQYGGNQLSPLQVQIQNPAPDYNYKFDNLSSSMYSVQTELSQLTLLMRGIVAELKQMAEQNRQLMEKMAADPLIHIRKQVAEFNLE